MKICVPTQDDLGIDSVAYGHFGSAPYFIIHDTETGQTKSLANMDQHHAHGTCSPMSTLDGESVEAVIVGGIGRGAISGLAAAGIKVYRSTNGTVGDNVAALKVGALVELTPQDACAGHGHGSDCGK
ncbi:MAG: NifB/NifX family molybdenum-iron cluster-binding protein [Planctomycetota bacterium]|nr:NifB/NifX family molybdenum-iron cluster-binding protein [Planctomycetota bacterium]